MAGWKSNTAVSEICIKAIRPVLCACNAVKLRLRELEKLHGIKLVGVSFENARKKTAQLEGADAIEKTLQIYHRKYTKAELKAECIRMLERVGIDQPPLR